VSRINFKVNHQIKSATLRVIGAAGENLGVLPLGEALAKAEAAGLDLIEVSPFSTPPVAKITDYGKFLYDEEKKRKQAKSRTQTSEIKEIQITIGTSEHDLTLKAKKASDWLTNDQRVRINLFLRGRARYMNPKFLQERIERILNLITTNFKISDPIKKSPKGLSVMIEKVKN
jgi:translation initiation factor IF-3